jgi:hypothetical protein
VTVGNAMLSTDVMSIDFGGMKTARVEPLWFSMYAGDPSVAPSVTIAAQKTLVGSFDSYESGPAVVDVALWSDGGEPRHLLMKSCHHRGIISFVRLDVVRQPHTLLLSPPRLSRPPRNSHPFAF